MAYQRKVFYLDDFNHLFKVRKVSRLLHRHHQPINIRSPPRTNPLDRDRVALAPVESRMQRAAGGISRGLEESNLPACIPIHPHVCIPRARVPVEELDPDGRDPVNVALDAAEGDTAPVGATDVARGDLVGALGAVDVAGLAAVGGTLRLVRVLGGRV